jgi:rubrerythrin
MSTPAERVTFLNAVLSDTVNSIVQYAGISMPYVAPDCAGHKETMDRIRDEENVHAHTLNELIQRSDGVPTVEAFPYWNIDLNYLDLRFMARFAVTHQEKAIRRIEEGADVLRIDPVAHTRIQGILEEKRRHLGELEEIGKKPEPEPEPESEPAAE